MLNLFQSLLYSILLNKNKAIAFTLKNKVFFSEKFRNFFLKRKSYASIIHISKKTVADKNTVKMVSKKRLFKIISIVNFVFFLLSWKNEVFTAWPAVLTSKNEAFKTDRTIDRTTTQGHFLKKTLKLRNKSAIYYHIKELKLRIFYLTISFLCTFFSCYYYSFEMIYLFVKPFLAYEKNFIFTDLTEAFYTTIKLNFIISIYILIPFFIYQVWCFIIPSSFLKERQKYNFFCITIFTLFNFSLIFVYFLLLPELYKFLLNFQVNTNFMSIQLEARIHSYVELACKIFFFSSLLFQIPIIFFLAFKYGLLNTNFLIENRAKIFL